MQIKKKNRTAFRIIWRDCKEWAENEEEKKRGERRTEHIKYLPMSNGGYFNDMKNTRAFTFQRFYHSIGTRWNGISICVCLCLSWCAFCVPTVRRLRMLLFNSLLAFLQFSFLSFLWHPFHLRVLRYSHLLSQIPFYGSHSICETNSLAYPHSFSPLLFSFSRLIIIIIQSIQQPNVWRHRSFTCHIR